MSKYYSVAPNVVPDFVAGVLDMMDMLEDIIPFTIEGINYQLRDVALPDDERKELIDLVDRLELVKEELEDRNHG